MNTHAMMAAFLSVICLNATPPPAHAANTGQMPDWFGAPVERDRHTTLIARFDDSESCDADYARGDHRSNGLWFDPSVDGMLGGGVEIDKGQSQIHFSGKGNVREARGTLEFWVRGNKKGRNIWNDGNGHWFFSARATDNDLQLYKDTDNKLRLVWGRRPYKGAENVVGSVEVSVHNLKADAWHHLAVSWDSNAGRIWLAVNGKWRSIQMESQMDVQEFFLVFLGASHDGGWDKKDATIAFATAGATLDELKISDITMPEMVSLHGGETYLTDDLAMRLNDAVTKHLDFMALHQRNGAWSAPAYSWPAMIPCETSYRPFAHAGRWVNFVHGANGTPGLGQLYLLAYKVLGDQRYLDIAEQAGDWVVAAQDPEGYWFFRYDRHTASRPTVKGDSTETAFHDGLQHMPAMLLATLYEATGEAKWLQAFVRSSEFLLGAQNPNGSWSHNYDVAEKTSVNRFGERQSGDFSNGIMHSQMTVMLVAYGITGEKKYAESLVRAADWIASAQLGPPTYGWAAHYNEDNKPSWGRVFEPPSMSQVGAQDLLLSMYDMTGDARYLEPVARYARWEQERSTITLTFADGTEKMGRSQYYEIDTGRGIRSNNRTIVHLDDAEERAAMLLDLMANPDELSDGEFRWVSPPDPESTTDDLAMRQAGARPEPQAMTEAEMIAWIEQMMPKAEEMLATQNEHGVWPRVDDRITTIGQKVMMFEYNISQMLTLLQQSKILSGEMDGQIWSYPSILPYYHGLPLLKYRNWRAEATKALMSMSQ